MRNRPEQFEFTPEDADQVLGRMAELDRERTGWIVLQPGFDADEADLPATGIFSVFSGKTVDVPVVSWVPESPKSRRTTTAGEYPVSAPISIGIQHPARKRALPILRDAGVAIPAGWRMTQDHPVRGLVLLVAGGGDHLFALRWMVDAGALLSPVPLTGSWRASVFRRRT
jgi:hypothetical protein